MRRISVAIFCLFTTFAPAQPAYQAVQTPLTIQPTHQLSFPDSPDIGSVAFSPDGKVLYVHLRPAAVDVWEMLVYVWPEGLGAVVAIAAAVAGLVAWRVRRWPQNKGVMYCRKCNYDLSGLPTGAGACPECGADLERKRPRSGRSVWRRAGPALAVFAILACGYGAMWAAWLPRSGIASSWFEWSSTSLYRAAHARGMTLLSRFETAVDRVVAVDVATGAVSRTVCTRRSVTYFPISLLPDDTGLFLSDARSGVVLIDTGTGLVRARLNPNPPDEFNSPDGETIVGFGDSGQLVYAVGTSQDNKRTHVLEWDLRTGRSRIVHDTEAFGYGPRRVLMLPGEPGPRFVIAPDFMEAYNTKQYVLTFVGPGVESRAPIRMPDITSPSGTPVVSRDGTKLFASAMSRGIVGIDLATGSALGVLIPGHRDTPLDQLAINAGGDRLFVSVHPNSILVRDMAGQAWIARLVYPSRLIAPHLFVSPDGRWLAAVPFSAAGPTGPFLHEVLLFDLSGIPKPGSLETN